LKAHFTFGNSQKSFGAKSGEQGGSSISAIDFWARNCLLDRVHLVSWSMVMVENPITGPKFRPCLGTASYNYFSIST